MNNAFDYLADRYDMDFTFTKIGRIQRSQVFAYLERRILRGRQLDILELNCGTGEDAIWLTKAGHRVLATDASAEMIRVAQTKISKQSLLNLTFQQFSFADLIREPMNHSFDLVFSDFGGLNCTGPHELEKLISHIAKLLKPGGRFMGVIMSRKCLWENLYFVYKGRWNEISRRNREDFLEVNLLGVPVRVWYYSPRRIRKMAGDFYAVSFRPVGFAIPPTYLDDYFKNKLTWLKILTLIDRLVNKISLLANYSDHFLFDLKVKYNSQNP
jgi:ubiquinone/menaquinone biosynthesis C-methylase UbiE